MNKGELKLGEPHPAAFMAKAWIESMPLAKRAMWQESFASCAIEGNRLGEICSETLNRLWTGKPVSDRYLLGLAWTMVHAEQLGLAESPTVKKGGKRARRKK